MDLLIVGGGVVGVMTAVHARMENPQWTVRVVERDRVAHGATGASAGLSFPLARSSWQAELVRESHAGFSWLREEFPDLPIYDIPVLWVIGRTQVGELADRVVDGAVVPATEAQLAALRIAYPDFVVDSDEVVVTTDAPCFYGYPARVTEQLVNWLRRDDSGVIWEGVGVERIDFDAVSGWRVRLSDGRIVAADRVVVATGPWPTAGLVPVGLGAEDLPVKKVAALHLGHNPPPGAPCVVLWGDDAFVLPLPGQSHCLFSYRNTTWGVHPDEPIRLLPADVDEALAVLTPRSKYLADSYIGGRAFCDAYTEDFAPRLREHAGLVEARGCSGSGFRLAPGLAAAALSAASARRSPSFGNDEDPAPHMVNGRP